MRAKYGFTLIELLIVVAIIAILAAIAVPNFLEAQTRAKISRVKADQRTIATACEAYKVDTNWYPVWFDPNKPSTGTWGFAAFYALQPLTTPIAYMSTTDQPDPFNSCKFQLDGWTKSCFGFVIYKHTGNTGSKCQTFGDYYADYGIPDWDSATVYCLGPNTQQRTAADNTAPEWWGYFYKGANTSRMTVAPNPVALSNQCYDPTNGTMSKGSLFRIMGETHGYQPPNLK
jgi:prepilin-type N-terminal cleavage/methylation domain-containing protein